MKGVYYFMDISLKHENYKFLKTNRENTVEEIVEADFSLPEYLPEILRIIKSTAEPKIHSCSLVGERITVDGVCDLKMIYTAEDGGIYSFSTSKPFTRHCENKDFADAIDVNASLKVSYVNCRATSTKRAEIKAGITIRFNVFFEEKEDIISLNDAKCIEEKKVCVNAVSLGCKKTRSFSLSDTLTLQKNALFIICSNACAVLTETRKINNKIMVKGDAIVDISYVDSNDKSMTENIKHIIPINQILEFEGMEERFNGNVTLNVTALEVIPKGESNGAISGLDISLGIDVSISMWEEKQMDVISDAYAIGAAIELKKSNYEFLSLMTEIKDSFIYDSSFSVSGEGVSCVLSKWAEITGVMVKKENDNLVVTGNISVSLIIKDNADSVSCINKMFDFSYSQRNDAFDENIAFEPCIVLSSLDCRVKGENNIELRAEINISGSVFSKMNIDVVTDIYESDKPFVCNKNAITVYFPGEKNESLWTIARKYNTTVRAIAAENALEGDTTENLKMLFIPSA